MYRIESKIDTKSQEFKDNQAAMEQTVSLLKERVELIKQGGPPKARELHTSRGKMLVRDRLKKLFDKNTPFLELSTLAAYNMYENETPAASMVTGIGVVHG
ncbi:MAG TPA: carboxyl transferase domain-containing protein, partial [bacterium]